MKDVCWRALADSTLSAENSIRTVRELMAAWASNFGTWPRRELANLLEISGQSVVQMLSL
jgi:hypothetical protein